MYWNYDNTMTHAENVWRNEMTFHVQTI